MFKACFKTCCPGTEHPPCFRWFIFALFAVAFSNHRGVDRLLAQGGVSALKGPCFKIDPGGALPASVGVHLPNSSREADFKSICQVPSPVAKSMLQ